MEKEKVIPEKYFPSCSEAVIRCRDIRLDRDNNRLRDGEINMRIMAYIKERVIHGARQAINLDISMASEEYGRGIEKVYNQSFYIPVPLLLGYKFRWDIDYRLGDIITEVNRMPPFSEDCKISLSRYHEYAYETSDGFLRFNLIMSKEFGEYGAKGRSRGFTTNCLILPVVATLLGLLPLMYEFEGFLAATVIFLNVLGWVTIDE